VSDLCFFVSMILMYGGWDWYKTRKLRGMKASLIVDWQCDECLFEQKSLQ
jgi:hypothetical protein